MSRGLGDVYKRQMYEIPKDDNIGTVTITKDYVEKKGGPLIQMRGTPELADSQHV